MVKTHENSCVPQSPQRSGESSPIGVLPRVSANERPAWCIEGLLSGDERGNVWVVPGSEFRVPSSGFRVPGCGFCDQDYDYEQWQERNEEWERGEV